jgi:predicted heme/steroid binding protein
MNISDLITKYENDICYFQQMQIYSMTTYEKNYYCEQIQQRTNELIGELGRIMQLEVKSVDNPPGENSYVIKHMQEENGPTEEYPYNFENEINSEYSTEKLPEQEFTLEELAEYNGTNGKPPYVAINGIVYDMSHIRPWASGTHFGLSAGNNLTAQFMGCHRGAQSVLNKLIQVGRLVQ